LLNTFMRKRKEASRSIPLTNGSWSGRPKNMRIRIPNTISLICRASVYSVQVRCVSCLSSFLVYFSIRIVGFIIALSNHGNLLIQLLPCGIMCPFSIHLCHDSLFFILIWLHLLTAGTAYYCLMLVIVCLKYFFAVAGFCLHIPWSTFTTLSSVILTGMHSLILSIDKFKYSWWYKLTQTL
jgi:hypothetical protein